MNANDVVYGVKRTVDPATASDYSYVLYIIKNAQAVNEGSEEFTLDDMGVVALDETTVQFTLENTRGLLPVDRQYVDQYADAAVDDRGMGRRQVDRSWPDRHQRPLRYWKNGSTVVHLTW